MQILIIDDDHALCRSLQIHLAREGHTVECTYSGESGLKALEAVPVDLAFVDLQLPDMLGLEILRKLKESEANCLAVMITGTQDTEATIEAVRLGAFDYIRKPLDLDAVLLTIEKASQHFVMPDSTQIASLAEPSDSPHEIVGAAPEIIEVLKQIALHSQSRIPVLIQGESGTGKELVARALHETSSKGRPFVAINCSAIVPTLLESELFGHEKGAFTGAAGRKRGKLEVAEEGTLFFDEIGDMSFDLQAKLLRALQEREFERVGGTETIQLNARVVAATNQNLEALVSEKKFRKDLYYRLAVSTINVPSLRERTSDIPLIAAELIGRICKDLDKNVDYVEEAVFRKLEAHDWPGNVRELRNVLMRAVVLSRNETITESVVVEAMGMGGGPHQDMEVPPAERTLREAEKLHVRAILQASGWNISRASATLDISRVTLRKKITDYQLTPPPDKRARRSAN